MKEWNEYKSIMAEVNDFQKKMLSKHKAGKERLLALGPQKNTAPYTVKPSMERSKSAPPSFAAIGESEVDLVPQTQDDLNRDVWDKDTMLKTEISEKLLRIARDFYEKLENILIQNYKTNKFEQIISAIIKNSFEIYFLIIIISIFFLTDKQLQINTLLSYSVFAFAAYKIIPSFHVIYSHLISFLGSSNPLKIIAAELLNKNLYPEIIKDNFSIKKVKLNNVSFSFNKTKNVLNNINYELQENKIVGICGKSGSGKTTFIDLVSGLMSPTQGVILINEKNYEDANEQLISNSAYCSQKTMLIDDTIENNICLDASYTIDKKLLYKAIKIAQLEEFVKNFKNGIHTIIGEEGVRVSGG